MFLEALIELNASIGSGFDQMNPAARRFRFQLQDAISRTLVQTKAAVNALVKLWKVKTGQSSIIGMRYFAVRRFQLPPFTVLCLESGSQVGNSYCEGSRGAKLETRNGFRSYP
jgi:hypothetical protein